MKKLALAIASLALASAPVLACPGHDAVTDQDQAPKTAEKAKDQKDQKDQKAQPKQDDKAKAAPKQADKAKPAPAKPAPKAGEKVSSK